MLQTLSHTEVLQCNADAIWTVFQHADIILCNAIPNVFSKCEYVRGRGEPGSIRVLTLGPEMKANSSTGFVKEHIDKVDHSTRTLSYTILEGGDPRYSHYAAEFRYDSVGETSEATWTAYFEPIGDMGPPYHLKAMAPMVFKLFERIALSKKSFTHSETLEGSPDAIWKAHKHSMNIIYPPMTMPEVSMLTTIIEGKCAKLPSIHVIKIVDPALPDIKELTQRFETCDDITKKLGYSLLFDPQYLYFTAIEEFAPGPEGGTTTATWVATYSAASENMDAPETIKSIVVSQWNTTQEAAKANPRSLDV